MGYSCPGKNSIFPLDAILNLPADIDSIGLRKAIAIEVSKSSFSEATESIKRYTGIKIYKRQAETLCQYASQDFNEYYEQKCSSSQQIQLKNCLCWS